MTSEIVGVRARREILRLAHAGLDSRALMVQTIQRLRAAIPIDAAFFATADPATGLFTGSVADDVLMGATPQFLTNEFLEDDVNKFRRLAHGGHRVATLDAATRHQPERSPRYRDILAPLALGDELRVALSMDGVTWGFICLHRERGGTPFSAGEAEFLDGLREHLAAGLRKALLIGGVTDLPAPGAPGLLILAEDFSLVATTPAADYWLAELVASDWPAGRALPLAVYAVAGRLLALEQDAGAPAAHPPRVRLRTRTGQWLTLHASRLRGPAPPAPIAVFLEAAQPFEIAPLIAQAYDLTPREAELAQCALRGLSTAQMAAALHISPNTVQDHLKAIFDKAGVRSRRELIARIFTQQYQPHIAAGERPDSSGQFR
jgi:DNA-binding CsgD family transcriptional regulator